MKKFYLLILAFFCFYSFLKSQAPAPAFVNNIQIPPKIVFNTSGSYDLDMIQTTHDFNPQVPNSPLNGVPTFAFEDFNNPGKTTILGPTIIWDYKTTYNPSVLNRLSERSTCHWHGAHVPNKADGGPYQIIEPDSLWEPTFEVLDESATLWYHPHAMGLTYKHVQMGMSGIIIVEDPEDDPVLSIIHEIIPTEYGVDDIPLIFQTKKFTTGPNGATIIQAEGGFKDGYEYMVNGIIDPVLTVPADMIRLRLLNGDGKFSFNFSFVKEDGTLFNDAAMIATDAGYMTQTFLLDDILMAPGERTEWLIDLRGLNGDSIYIRNNVSDMPFSDTPCGNGQRGIIGDSCTTKGWAADRNLLKIKIGPSTQSPSPIIAFPFSLDSNQDIPPISEVSNTRTKVFREGVFTNSMGKPIFSIDSALMDMTVVNDIVKLDSTEIWTLENLTPVAHPWHIHDIHFWVTEVIDGNGNALNKAEYPEIFSGPKDNILVQPGWKLSYIATFADYGTPVEPANSYMYHCHILPHEDSGMMGTFVVWNGDPISAVDPGENAVAMKVSPNPAQEVLYLEGSSAKRSMLRFIDLQGRLLKVLTLPSFDGAIQLDTDQLPEGMVIMEWTTEEGRAVRKVMIQN